MLFRVSFVDVVLVRWPAERGRRTELQQLGMAVLLLVEDGHHPPLADTCLEDWIRVPASEVDVRARIDALSVRSELHADAQAAEPPAPHLDEDGVLRAHGGWVAVPPVEARLLRAMLARFGAVVSRENLSSAGWPDRAPERNVLDVHVLRLRRRLASVGLVIRTVRSRGYLLETDRPQPLRAAPWAATDSIFARTSASSPR